MAVHDINMHPVGAVDHEAAAFCTEFGEISREDGWGDDCGG